MQLPLYCSARSLRYSSRWFLSKLLLGSFSLFRKVDHGYRSFVHAVLRRAFAGALSVCPLLVFAGGANFAIVPNPSGYTVVPNVLYQNKDFIPASNSERTVFGGPTGLRLIDGKPHAVARGVINTPRSVTPVVVDVTAKVSSSKLAKVGTALAKRAPLIQAGLAARDVWRVLTEDNNIVEDTTNPADDKHFAVRRPAVPGFWADDGGYVYSASDHCSFLAAALNVGAVSYGPYCYSYVEGFGYSKRWVYEHRPQSDLPVDDAYVEQALAGSVETGDFTANEVGNIMEAAEADAPLKSYVDSTGGWLETPTVTGPATTLGPSKMVAEPGPNGTTVFKEQQVINNWYYNNNNITYNNTNVTNTTNPDGTTSTTTTTSDPPPDYPTDCDKYPDSIGCAKFGDIPIAESIPNVDVPVSITPVTGFSSSASCPAPITFDVFGQQYAIEYTAACDFFSAARYLVLTVSGILASLIFVSAFRT